MSRAAAGVPEEEEKETLVGVSGRRRRSNASLSLFLRRATQFVAFADEAATAGDEVRNCPCRKKRGGKERRRKTGTACRTCIF